LFYIDKINIGNPSLNRWIFDFFRASIPPETLSSLGWPPTFANSNFAIIPVEE